MKFEDLNNKSQAQLFARLCREGKIKPEDYPKSQMAMRLLVRALRSE